MAEDSEWNAVEFFQLSTLGMCVSMDPGRNVGRHVDVYTGVQYFPNHLDLISSQRNIFDDLKDCSGMVFQVLKAYQDGYLMGNIPICCCLDYCVYLCTGGVFVFLCRQ